MTENPKIQRYRIGGMDCAACANKIDSAVRRLPGIENVQVSAMAGTLKVTYATPEALRPVRSIVERLGYSVAEAGEFQRGEPVEHEAKDACCGHSHDHHHDDDHGRAHHHPREAIAAVGGHHHAHAKESPGLPWFQQEKYLLPMASAAAIAAAYIVSRFAPDFREAAIALAMLIGLVPIARRAFMAAMAGIPFTIETLMTVAAIGAVFIHAGEEAATVVFLFLVGELLEGVAAGKARASIKSLSALAPRTVRRLSGDHVEEIDGGMVAIDDVILVRPGDRIGAEGVIIEGESAIDEGPITGESVPVRKKPGDNAFAGTINGDGVLKIRVTATAGDNMIARIVRLVEEAQESKSPTERFIDRFSKYYTPGVLVVGALVATVPPLLVGAGWQDWIYKGLAVLLIGCPCALVISTPAAIAASLSNGARRGLLLKGGAVLENLGKVSAVAFDKTGTLTTGKPEVTDVKAISSDRREILRLATAVEQGSSHPLALAIVAAAKSENISIPGAEAAQAIPGKGVRAIVEGKQVFVGSLNAAAEMSGLPEEKRLEIEDMNKQGNTLAIVVVDDVIEGVIAMRDMPREDAHTGVASLKASGIATVMLTGDNIATARRVGEMLGLNRIEAGLLPENKQEIVKKLKNEGYFVAKVGDGINDAPALAMADVGIAMGGGTDVALETADAAILHGRVGDVARMIDLSHNTMRNIRENITIALGLKLIFLVTTLSGITGLWPAILADTGATVLVTANALRLLK